MDLNELQQLVAWVEASDLHCLELCGPDGHIKLTRSVSDQVVIEKTDGPQNQTEQLSRGSAETTVSTEAAGVFLTTHPMRATPFAMVGDFVDRNAVLGLLKIGHIYAPVRAPTDGEVTAIMAIDNALVGFGTPVFKIAPAPDIAGG